MFSNLYLLKMNLIETIPEWLEAIGLVCTGGGGVWIWWRKQEQKRLTSIENAQNQILKGYDSLLEEFQVSRQEKDNRIKDLVRENSKLLRKQSTMQLTIQEQQSIIESLRFFNKTLKRLKDAPDEVIEETINWLEGSPLNEFIEGEKSIREILLERVERTSDPDLSNLPPSQG